jgi:hypothetical protein
MRWAYSGSMRPEFKVLACEAFRAELCVLQSKSGFWSRFRHLDNTLQPCKALGTRMNSAFDY